MDARFLSEAEYQALKAAFRTLVKAAGGPTRAAEEITRTDPARISRYGNPHEKMHAPIDVIADLEAEVGEPIVTRILADMAGFTLVPKAAPREETDQFTRHLAEVAQSAGSVLGALGEALADNGTVDVHEVASVDDRAHHLETQVAELRQDLKRRRAAAPIPIRRNG